jgi:hypothetical protein
VPAAICAKSRKSAHERANEQRHADSHFPPAQDREKQKNRPERQARGGSIPTGDGAVNHRPFTIHDLPDHVPAE